MPRKVSKPMRYKNKLVEESEYPILMSIALDWLQYSNRRIKEGTSSRKKSFSTFEAAANEGVRFDLLHGVADKSMTDALRAATGGVDTNDDGESFLQRNLIANYVDKAGLSV
jgi:hypothetical protein